MPPKPKISREAMLKGALDLVRDQGWDALNARNLASRLGCSTQPIFSHFSAMEELKAAVLQEAEQLYNTAMWAGLQDGGEDFLGMGMAYIDFARTEPQLFQLLFMSGSMVQGDLTSIAGTTEGDDQVIAFLSSNTGLSLDEAQKLYTTLWFAVHGIASLLATNGGKIDEQEARSVLRHTFKGVIYSLKQEREDVH
ncbi:TetR family transcriptional regulator [Paenibacillus antibioticophila]|uniref:TetR family transcriptional regulator n=1 Tax=Paenibacillus antibioticophila TaxID=1274374 RepID=A0A919XP45_9BACL|nr:TetR/AcrR family transcriptional regulator [Paenibacillus antibioticophila]GIO36636.1 TetR family transcriptional regulator [Paenibacillus antibioticophila]